LFKSCTCRQDGKINKYKNPSKIAGTKHGAKHRPLPTKIKEMYEKAGRKLSHTIGFAVSSEQSP
jgi:hypothetical protein